MLVDRIQQPPLTHTIHHHSESPLQETTNSNAQRSGLLKKDDAYSPNDRRIRFHTPEPRKPTLLTAQRRWNPVVLSFGSNSNTQKILLKVERAQKNSAQCQQPQNCPPSLTIRPEGLPANGTRDNWIFTDANAAPTRIFMTRKPRADATSATSNGDQFRKALSPGSNIQQPRPYGPRRQCRHPPSVQSYSADSSLYNPPECAFPHDRASTSSAPATR